MLNSVLFHHLAPLRIFNMAQKPRLIYLLKPISGINITAVALDVTAVIFFIKQLTALCKTNKKLSCRRETARRIGHTLRETDGRTESRSKKAICSMRRA